MRGHKAVSVVDKPTKQELRYWEQVLHDHRLGMGRGRSTKVDFVGGDSDLLVTEHKVVAKKVGRKKPKASNE